MANMHSLFKNVVIGRCLTEIAAGSTIYQSNIIDTRGYDGVAFVAALGTVSTLATNGIHAEMAATTATTDMVDVEASGTTGGGDAASGGICLVDLGRPRKRYYRAVVDRATANSVISGVFYLLYNPVHRAVTLSTVASSSLVLGSTFVSYQTTGASTGS